MPSSQQVSGRSLRVALVTETFPPEINGVAHTVAHFAYGLTKRGHKLELIRPRQPGDLVPTNESTLLVRGLSIPGYPELRLGLPAGGRLRRAWSYSPPDVLYVATEGPLGWSAVRTAERYGIPCVSGFHTQFEAYSNHYRVGFLRSVIRRYLRALHRRSTCTIVPTEALRQSLDRNAFGNLHVIGRGVDTEHFSPVRRSDALRSTWGAGPNDPVVAYVGRLAPEKNLPLALRGADAMKLHNPRVRFVVIGDGPLYQALLDRRQDVEFLGAKSGLDLAAHYASADILLFPSETETFGNVVLEAMASGLPVVAFDYAAAHAVIEPGVDGMVAPPGNAEAFIGTAVELARDPERARSIGAKAVLKARGYDWERVLDQLEQLLYHVSVGGKE